MAVSGPDPGHRHQPLDRIHRLRACPQRRVQLGELGSQRRLLALAARQGVRQARGRPTRQRAPRRERRPHRGHPRRHRIAARPPAIVVRMQDLPLAEQRPQLADLPRRDVDRVRVHPALQRLGDPVRIAPVGFLP